MCRKLKRVQHVKICTLSDLSSATLKAGTTLRLLSLRLSGLCNKQTMPVGWVDGQMRL